MKETPPFTPFIPPQTKIPEFTLRATILGVILGLFFCVANAYIGLKVGITISASIPAAVLSMGILRLFFKNVSILENNLVQTIASVGEGLAAGVIFTVPALYLFHEPISNSKLFLLSFLGGVLGILFMIPMRRYIIVKEHGILPFPEGTACSEILKLTTESAKTGVMALWGIIIGAVYKILTGVFNLFSDLSVFVIKPFQNAQFRIDGTPALLGVGYIIGPLIATITFAGGALAWWVFIPMIKLYGQGRSTIFPSDMLISEMTSVEIWSNYIRYIGAGTVAVGGVYNLIRIFPLIAKTVHLGCKELFSGFQNEQHLIRTDRDISMKWLILGSIAIIFLLWLLPCFEMNLFTIVLLTLLGYFFVAVTSITVGLVGSSSNPASGMVMTTLLITSFIFVALGWTEKIYLIMAITMSIVINIAICLASTTSQDLKTGYLLGATPKWQQISEIIGLILPTLVIGVVLSLLNDAYLFGSTNLPAPQATLLLIIAKGVIAHELPVVLVIFGIILGVILLLLQVNVLPFAIGLYLPLEISTAIMVGGLARLAVQKFHRADKEGNAGVLIASGLVAGDACMGVIIAFLTVLGIHQISSTPLLGPTFGLIFFLAFALAFTLLALKEKKC